MVLIIDLNLNGKIALVSGSGRGIGKAIAGILLSEGCTVFINGRDEKTLNTTAEELRNKTPLHKIYKICSDLTITENIKSALDFIYNKTQKYPEIIVANIGSGKSVSGWDIDDEEWLRMFNLNFFGAVRLCREAVRVMTEHGGGSIVCISSIAGCEAIPAPLPYSIAKAALLSFVKNCANEVAQYKIRINAVSPGNVLFEGGTWDRKLKENKDAVLSYLNNAVPLKGFASPDDIAYMTAYLVSDYARFITGSNFIVDGGQVKKFI